MERQQKRKKSEVATPLWMRRLKKTLPDIQKKKKLYETWLANMLKDMRKNTRPAVCKWLSEESYILPEVVNIVYMTSVKSKRFQAPLDLVRLAQFLPNTKYRPPNFAAVTVRLRPTTARIFMAGTLMVIRSITPYMALYYSQMYRQLIERVPLILKGPNIGDKPYIGTLEGYLEFSKGQIQNVVASGALPQDGVHLMRLLDANEEDINYDPGTFTNLFYTGHTSSGHKFCSNIANTGNVVVMGLDTIESIYEAYKITCNVVHDFDDLNVPSNPKERHKYRMKQLQADPRFVTDEAGIGNKILGGEEEEDGGEDDDTNNVAVANMEKLLNRLGDNNADGPAFMQRKVVDIPPPQIQGQEEDPLLFQAALKRQVGNVRYILNQPGKEQR